MKDKTFTKEDIDNMIKRNNIKQFESYEPEWINLAEVKIKTQPWFWLNMIPSETLTLFSGVGAIGKSLLLIYLIAKTTRGESFNAGGITHTLPKGGCILLSAEDDIESQLKPKLIAANADFSKIHFINSKTSNISKKRKFLELNLDIYIVEQKIIEQGDIKFMVIDPISYFLGDVRDHYNSEVANFLQLLIDLAKKYGIAIVLNKHLRKQSGGTKGMVLAAEEVGGASSWTNTPRRCWLINNHPEDLSLKVITKLKDNLGTKDKQSLGFRIVPTVIYEDGIPIETTSIEWLSDMQNISAEETINEEKYEMSKLKEALEFIYNYLKENGQSLYVNIKSSALKKGIMSGTFRRAGEKFEQEYKDCLKITRGIRNAKMYELDE